MSFSSDIMMDPNNSFLGRELLEEITPVIMVLSTPLVEEACQKNGISFIDMLRPFSVFKRIDVPVRTASDQPYRLQMFKLRLVYSSDIRQPNCEAAGEHLKKVVGDASETALELQADPPNFETILTKSESDCGPLWIKAFNKELIRTVSFSEHEAFDHPVACLLAVSSKDSQPVRKFVDLFNTNQLPPLLNEGVMDPKILKHYLLVHDNQDDTAEKGGSVFAEMLSTFGVHDCKLLCINSAEDANEELTDNPSLPSGQDIGRYLNIDDHNAIREFMQELASKHIIPHMEQKIRILNQQVSATRKGFRNQIKNLWWRKKEDTPEAPNGLAYAFSSIESQIRILGDYAFMLRDYELALSNYRLLSTDYKLDKAWKRYAGVQEMMGLTYFMLDQSRKDSEYCMETAFNTYLKLGPPGQRNATRCGLWWADLLKARGQYKDAAGIYFRISNEEPTLHAAVMLEQASYCYLLSVPPMLRKYGFHLILAGNKYYLSKQRQHAVRVYKNALAVYKGHAWNYISDHVHFNIGRWYAFLGISDVALRHMLEVLACTHQSQTTQDLFLKEFFQTVENLGKTFEVSKLQLPLINISSYKVIYEDHRTYASPADANMEESLWQTLEEDMVPSTYTVRSNWLDSQPKSSPLKKYNNSHVCVVGEPIKLDIELRNPLQISISVTGISLLCDICASSEVEESDRSASTTSIQDGELGEPLSCRNLNNDASSVTSPELDFLLRGGETKMVQLSVIPKMEGILKILGIRWKLSGLVGGFHYFEFDTKKRHKREKKGHKHPASDDLSFIVIKGLPKLEGCIKNLPRKTSAGDLRLVLLELRNHSEYSAKNMKMKISHPRFLIPGSLEDLNREFPNYVEDHTNFKRKDIQPNVVEKSNGLLFSFPSDATIGGAATFVWPLWFHTGHFGKISLYMSIYYEMESCASNMIYRTLRMHHDVEVLPSLDVSLTIAPCASKLKEFIVRMDITNRTVSENIHLQQLSCVGDRWEISTLPTYHSICSTQMLFSGQALSCFFKLKERTESSDNDIQGSDILLGSQESDEKLIDIYQSPFADFHYHERHNQAKLVQVNPSTADFILISKMQKDDSNPNDPSPLLSNHVCYCSLTNNSSPIWWLMDGPRTITHDFSTSSCEASFNLRIHNCSPSAAVAVKVTTFDDSSEYQGGWQDVSLAAGDDSPVGSRSEKQKTQSVSPYVWCASSSTQLKLGPENSVVIPLRICLFAPGTYDLSNYELHWKLSLPEEGLRDESKRLFPEGTGRGHSFYLTALQSAPSASL